MINTFETLFGAYSPVTVLVSGTVENGDAVYQVVTNWGAVASYVVIAITFYSIFRLIGILLGGSYK